MRTSHTLCLAASLAAGCLVLSACTDDSYSGRTDSRAQTPQYNSNLPGAAGSMSPDNPANKPGTPGYIPNNSNDNDRPNGYLNSDPNLQLAPTTQPSTLTPIPGTGSGTLEPGVGGSNGGLGGSGTTGNAPAGRIGSGE